MIRALLIALFSTSILSAGPTLSVRTLMVEGDSMPEWHVRIGEDNTTALAWPDSQPSTVIQLPIGTEIQLLEKGANEEGEAQFQESMKLAIPEGVTEVLLLGLSDGDGVKVLAIPDHFQKAKFNDWLVINLSERAVNLRYGKDKDPVELEPGQSGIYAVQGEAKSGEVVAEAKVREEMRMIYSTFWAAPEKQRSLVLFHDKDGTVKVRRIIDFLPLPE